MTYKDNFVAEVKCNGKILRIKDGAVHLPFGSEYTLLLKNLNSRKASVKVHIDGQDVLGYNSLILEPNSSTELEGFLSGTVARNSFKFIQKTKEVQDHRGDKIDDGLIRVEFAFEKPRPEFITKKVIHEHEHHDHHHHHHDHYYPRPYIYPSPFRWNHNDWFTDDSTIRYGSSTGGLCSSNVTYTNSGDGLMGSKVENCVRGLGDQSEGTVNVNMVQTDFLGIESLGQPLDDEGITVKGSECHQSFRYGPIGELEQAQVITIQLRGITGSGTKVQQSVTVSTKLPCSSCGTKSKSSFKYCPTCGTYLE